MINRLHGRPNGPCMQAENAIKSVDGLDPMINLTILHLRANNIRSLNKLSPHLVNLRYLNCRSIHTVYRLPFTFFSSILVIVNYVSSYLPAFLI